MRVFRDFNNVGVIKNPVVTMGSYDGVHCGHRKILEMVKDRAQQMHGESVVITFDPHPRKIIFPGEKIELLNSLDEKIKLLESVGIDNLIIVNFTPEFRMLSSYDFARNYLFEKLHTRVLVIGYNHHFGHNREGNFEYLDKLHTEYDFELQRIPKFDVENEKVSSTIIRSLLDQGKVDTAAKYLGQSYFIHGHINNSAEFVHDNPDKLIPQSGLYNVHLKLCGGEKNGILKITPNKKLIILSENDTPQCVDSKSVISFTNKIAD